MNAAPRYLPIYLDKSRGFLLYLSLLTAFLLAGCSRPTPPTAVVQYTIPDQPQAEAALRLLLPPNDPTVTLEPIRNTELFMISVIDSDPQKAADRANAIAEAMESKLGHITPMSKFAIWERASPFQK